MPGLGGQHAERDREVRLADARRAQKHDVAALAQEAPRGELVDQAPVDRGLLLEVEVLEPFLVRQLGELQVELTVLSCREGAARLRAGSRGSGCRTTARPRPACAAWSSCCPGDVEAQPLKSLAWLSVRRGCSRGDLLVGGQRGLLDSSCEGRAASAGLAAWRASAATSFQSRLDVRWLGHRWSPPAGPGVLGDDHVSWSGSRSAGLPWPPATVWPA